MKGATAFMKDTFLAILLISLAVPDRGRKCLRSRVTTMALTGRGPQHVSAKASINEIAYSPDGTRFGGRK